MLAKLPQKPQRLNASEEGTTYPWPPDFTHTQNVRCPEKKDWKKIYRNAKSAFLWGAEFSSFSRS